MSTRKKIGILGASGYTGADAVRLLARHPNVEIAALTANTRPPAVTSRPAASRFVPAWKTKIPSSTGGRTIGSPARGDPG